MGQITIRQTGGLGKNENTFCEYDNEVSLDFLNHKLALIASALDDNRQYACYFVGMGGLPKSSYLKLKYNFNVSVVWNESLLPRYLRFLDCIVASHAGLLKVSNPMCITDLFPIMIDQTMAGIYVFPKSYEAEFIELVKKNPLPENIDFGIKKFKDYFFYIVDADNVESSTGVYEIISYGCDAAYIFNVF